MLPRIQARESILESKRHAVGNVTLQSDSRQSIAREWEDTTGVKRPKAQRAPSPDALRALGIDVVTQKANG